MKNNNPAGIRLMRIKMGTANQKPVCSPIITPNNPINAI
jgi:hypothetical protein